MSIRSRWLFATGVIILVVLLILIVNRCEFGSELPEAPAHSESQGRLRGSELNVPQPMDEQGRQPEAQTKDDAPTSQRGRVLDAQFLFPLEAMVLVDSQPWTFCNARGEFAVAGALPGRPLQIEADGYESKLVIPELSNVLGVLEVLLDPVRSSAVIVLGGSGLPLPGVIVDWQAAVDPINAPSPSLLSDWIALRSHVSGRSIPKVTNAAGISRLRLSRPAFATVHDPESSGAISVRVAPGGEVVVRLSPYPARLQFLDDQTGAAIVGLEIEAWCPSEIASAANAYLTDQVGVVEIQASAYPLLIRRPRGDNGLEAMLPVSTGVTRGGREYGGGYLVVEEPDDESVRQIRLRRSGAQLLLLDARSGQPIEGRVWMGTARRADCPELGARASRCSVNVPRDGGRSEDNTFTCSNGLMPIPEVILQRIEREDLGPKPDTISLCASGYVPARIPLDSVNVRQSGLVHTVSLEPARPRWLRIRYANGEPFRSTVRVYAPEGDVRLWHDYGREDGMHGPLNWGGGGIQVGTGEDGRNDMDISASELEQSETLELIVPAYLGSLEVHGIPPTYSSANLRAKLGLSSDAALYRPTSGAADRCLFENIPCGSYAVGPESWIRAVELKLLEFRADGQTKEVLGTRRVVAEGRTTIVEWDPSWASSARIEGRVLAPVSTAGRLFLLPDYGPSTLDRKEAQAGMPRAVMSRRTKPVPIDRDGRYSIEVGEPVPRTIALCLSHGVGADWGTLESFQVVETIRPGESIQLSLGSVELERSGPHSSGRVLVEYVTLASGLRYPLDTAFQMRRIPWENEGPMLIVNIPLSVSSLKVGGRPIHVALKADEVVKIPWSRPDKHVLPTGK